MPVQATSLKVRDVTVRCHRAGHGETVMFLHGAGGYMQWLPFFDSLAHDYEVLVPEHPGFGASDDPPWIRSVSDLAMFYLDFIEVAELHGIHLIGHSLGGWISAEILVRDRASFRSLSLLAPAGIRVEGVPPGDTFLWNPEETARNLFYDQTFAERMLAQQPNEEQTDVMLKNRFTVTKLGWQPRWFNPDLEKWLHRIKLPALVIWGDHDKVMPPIYAARWRERLPDSQLLMLEKCGHLPQVEKSELVTKHICEFLKAMA